MRASDHLKRLDGNTALITGAARHRPRLRSAPRRRKSARGDRGHRQRRRAWRARRRGGDGRDRSDQAAIDAAAAAAVGRIGRIEILIDNAAIFAADPIADITRAERNRAFAINVGGTPLAMHAVARHMIARGGGGRIINLASQAGRRGEARVAVHCATKTAAISLTRSAAMNLIAHGLDANEISPGVVDGEHQDGVDAFFAKHEVKAPGQKRRELGQSGPCGRMGAA
jgi:D-sorbitol dehydrogenase (acceptor)